jgi:hypothetical protein
LKTNASLRYDKNQKFEGQFTHGLQPLQVLETKTSVCLYQTGFRIPTTTQISIDLTTRKER